jgi:nitronate monooxygenase
MSLPSALKSRLRLPAVGAPMFIISNPELVIAQCKAGIAGAFPALNARPAALLDEWLHRITSELAAWDELHPERLSAPFAVNQIVHKSNPRIEQDLAACVKWKVPVVITSLGAREEVNQAVRSYGGMTLHDVIDNRFAHKAIDKGATGLIAVAAGAGGHAGTTSPFALVQEIREWFSGPLALSGAIACGRSILAAQVMGADLAYIGSAFIATREANADARYKAMIAACDSSDIVYTNLFTGIAGNYLKPSVVSAGLDPEHLPASDPSAMNFGADGLAEAKMWRDIWGCGQGIGAVKAIMGTEEFVRKLAGEYEQAKQELAGPAICC